MMYHDRMGRFIMAIWICVSIYFLLMLIVGIVSVRRANSLTNFVVGGRSAGPWLSAFAYGTTYFSAVIFIGYAGRSGWDFGLWAVLIGVGNALIGAYLAWRVLAERTRKVTRRLKIKTMPQFFEKRFFSKSMKIYAAIIIFIFMTPYSASVYSGLSYLCEKVLGIDYHIAMLGIAVIAAVYLVAGGYIASLQADLIQGVIMIGGVIAMVFFIMRSDTVGSFANGVSGVYDIMVQDGMNASVSQTAIGVISLIILTSLGSWGMPQMIHKFYGIADEKSTKAGTVISTVFCAIIAVSAYFVGSLTRLFFAEVPVVNGIKNYDVMVPEILVSSLPAVLLGVILVLVLSASVSTLSGITLTSCSAFSLDLVQATLLPNMSKKTTLLVTRLLCLLFIAASYLIASFKSPILTLMAFSWGSVAGAFLAPYLLSLYWKGLNNTGAWAGLITGPLVCVTLAVLSGFNSANSAVFGVISIAASFAACFVGSKLGRKDTPEEITAKDQFYDNSFSLQAADTANV